VKFKSFRSTGSQFQAEPKYIHIGKTLIKDNGLFPYRTVTRPVSLLKSIKADAVLYLYYPIIVWSSMLSANCLMLYPIIK